MRVQVRLLRISGPLFNFTLSFAIFVCIFSLFLACRRGVDELVFVGDLIGKGPESVGVVRAVRELGARVVRGVCFVCICLYACVFRYWFFVHRQLGRLLSEPP